MSTAHKHDIEAVAAALLHDFDVHISNKSIVELRQLRRGELALFLKHRDVHPQALAARVDFLQRYGYSRDEIADALLECGAPLASAEALVVLDAGNGPIGGAGAGVNGGSMTSKPGDTPDKSHGNSKNQAPAPMQSLTRNLQLWRIGAPVYAYVSDHTYYPVPLLGIDPSRFEDIYCVAHQLPTGQYGPKQYFAAGFKGVVPDELPAQHLVNVGTTILAQPKSSYRGYVREALVLAVGPALADGSFTVDVEWAHDASRATVASTDIRLLKHPKLVEEEFEREDAERRRTLIGSQDKIASSNAFPIGGVAITASVVAVSTKLGAIATAPESEPADSVLITYNLKNFSRYPDIDANEQPRGMRTGAIFTSQYGDPLLHSDHKGFAVLPMCQEKFLTAVRVGDSSLVREISTMTGLAAMAEYGYNLTQVPRHPKSPLHMVKNPIVHIARISATRDTMFVDPEFPPTLASLAGWRVAVAEQKAVANAAFTGPVPPHPLRLSVAWRRASEVFFRPRLLNVGSRPRSIVPGVYSPPWLVSLCVAISDAQEFEDMFSPAEDGWIYGAYVVRIFLEGSWYFITVDDMIPCDAETGAPLTCRPGNGQNDIYAVILEKALAKLCGSYAELLESSKSTMTLPRAWEIFTSNVAECIDHRFLRSRDDATTNIQSMIIDERCTSGIHATVANLELSHDAMRFLGCGFALGATWHVRDVVAITHPVRGDKRYFFNVVRGDNDGDELAHSQQIREQLLENVDVNVRDLTTPAEDEPAVCYWITSHDYFIVFSNTYGLRTNNNCQRAVVKGSYEGRVGFGTKVAGTQPLLRNPQILLSVVQPTEIVVELQVLDPELAPLTGSIASLPPQRSKATAKATSLQVHVLRGAPVPVALTSEPLRLVASSVELNIIDDEDGRRFPTVSARAQLPAGGNFILIPTIGDMAASTAGFIIKVTSVSSFYLKILQ